MRFADAPDDLVLRPVGVLVLVDQDVAIAILELPPRFALVQELDHEDEQIVEVQLRCAAERIVVTAIRPPYQLVHVVDGVVQELLGRNQLVLEERYSADARPGVHRRLGDPEFAQRVLHCDELIRSVADRKVLPHSNAISIRAQ